MLMCTLVTASVIGSIIVRDGGNYSDITYDFCSPRNSVGAQTNTIIRKNVLFDIPDDQLQTLGNNQEEYTANALQALQRNQEWRGLFKHSDEEIDNIDDVRILQVEGLGTSIRNKRSIEDNINNEMISNFESYDSNENLRNERNERSPPKSYVSGLLKKSNKNSDKNQVTEKPADKKDEESDLSQRIVGGTSALQYMPVVSKFRSKTWDK